MCQGGGVDKDKIFLASTISLNDEYYKTFEYIMITFIKN